MVFHFRTPSFFYDSPVAQDTEVLREFSFKELKAATRNFCRDNLLKWGTCQVFKGKLRDGCLVAIKRIHKKERNAEDGFQREIEARSLGIRHPNIISLRGYCRTKEENLLVYPLMINNSLRDCLGPTRRISMVQPLSWEARKQIALGVARGLAHLHHYCDPKIIHRDVSTSNILLDQQFRAVIGDFGLARIMHQQDLVHGTIECPISDNIDIEDDDNGQLALFCDARSKYFLYNDTYVPTTVRGKNTCLAPEYLFTGKCTPKSDVFAFGYVLLNLMTGQSQMLINQPGFGFIIRSVDWVRALMPDKLEQLMDPDLQGNYVNQEAKQLVELALQCGHDDPRERPDMLEVVRVFEDLDETPRFPLSNSQPMTTLSRSQSDSTLFYSFSSSATSEAALECSADS